MRLDEANQQTQPRMGAVQANGSRNRASRDNVWRGNRVSFMSTIRLAFSRLASGRALLAAVGVGMLVAVTLVCTVPLFNALIIDIQLQREINSADPANRNVQVFVASDTSNSARQETESHVSVIATHYIKGFTSATPTQFTVSDSMILNSAGSNVYDPTKSPQVTLEAWDYSQIQPYMNFSAGGAPKPSTGSSIQVIVTNEFATDANLTVGSQINLWEFGAHQNQVNGTVVGIWKPKNAVDPFWNDTTFDAGGSPTTPKIYPVLTTQSDFFRVLSPYASSGMNMTSNWIYYTQPASINSDNMSTYHDNLTKFRSELSGQLQSFSNVSKIGVITQLDATIVGLNGQQTLLALPLYVVVSQVVALALLFVFAMAGLLIEGQSQEIATLKSRGASGAQLLGVFITQGVLLGLIAAVLGAVLAATLALTLIKLFVSASTLNSLLVNPTYLARLATPQTVIIPALIGASLGLLAIVFSALQMARLDVLAFRREQGRQSRQPFWARYYLDLALVALCAVGYIELGQFGSASIRAQLPSGSSSPLLLVTPALLLIGGSLLVLRIAPLAASLGERISSRGRGLSAMLAFAQVERTPAKYMRMTLLLTLAVGLGIFAITFNASLTRNVYDTTAYSVGANMRMVQGFTEPPTIEARIINAYKSQPGVEDIAPVYRTIAQTTADQQSENIALLAVDPNTFTQVVAPTAWRSDYAGQSLQSLMADLQANSSPSAGTGSPIWAIISQSYASQFQLHVGDHFSLNLSESFFGSTSFQVGAIVDEFPTLYPDQYPAGFLIANLTDFNRAVQAENQGQPVVVGPNEFWLRTNQTAAQEAALKQFVANQQSLTDNKNIFSLRDSLSAASDNPVSSGMRGLLLVGAMMAAMLAILGALVQSGMAAGQRSTQFAVLRTLGVDNGELIRSLLTEQALVYVFGLVGGSILGALLSTATLPFLQFSAGNVDQAVLGIPPYVLVTDFPSLGYFFGALLIAFVIALLIAARYAATIGLGKALRLGED